MADAPRHHNDPILLGYQRDWCADRTPVKVWEKSRRIGASWCEAADDALLAAESKDAGGMDVWYISYNRTMTETFIKDCAWWSKVYSLAAGDMEEFVFPDGNEEIAAFRIRYDSGHTITGLSSAPRSLRSIQGKIVIDEAAFVESLPELLKAAMAMLVWGGRVVVISTHDGEDNPFNELIQDVRAGKRPYSLHRTDFDRAIADGLFRRICKVKQSRARDDAERAGLAWSADAEVVWRQGMVDFYGDGADEELFCVPSRGSGTYLTRNLIESCMDPSIPVLRWTPPAADFVDWPVDRAFRETRDWCEAELAPLLGALPSAQRCFLGEDFGRSGDLTVLWPLQEMDNLVLWTPFVVELRNVPFRTQEQLTFHLMDRLPRFSGGAFDARGNGQFLAEAARQRYGPDFIAEVMLSEGWYREHMPKLKAQFEDRTIGIPKDARILDDLRAFRIMKGVAKLPETRTGDGKDKRHGDAGVAAALAVFAAKTIEGGGEAHVSTALLRATKSMFRGY